jgi:hypothetical protein
MVKVSPRFLKTNFLALSKPFNIMTANFSFSRLLQLIRKQWIENSRIYLLSTLALIGILGLVITFWIVSSNNDFNEQTLYIIFIFGIYITGAVFASTSFGMLSEKEKGAYWLGFPASHLEKMLTVLFFNVVVFTVVYAICFFVLKTIAISYVHNLVAQKPQFYKFYLVNWKSENGFASGFPYFIYAFFAVQAFYILGSVYFSRFSFLLTTVIGAALIFLFMWFAISLLKHNLPPFYTWDGFNVRYMNWSNTKDKIYQLPSLAANTLPFLLKFIWAPVFWLITWFRLKEKEI